MKGRLARIERGEPGWQGTAWFLERCYPKRFSKPELQLAQQINVGTRPEGCEIKVDEKLIEQLRAGYEELASHVPAVARPALRVESGEFGDESASSFPDPGGHGL